MAEAATSVRRTAKKRLFFGRDVRDTSLAAKRQLAKQKLTKLQRREVKAMMEKALELKYLDTTQAYTQIDRGGVLATLCNVGQGNTQSTRIADQLTQKYLIFNLDAYYNPTVINTDVGHKLRVILFRWVPDNGVNTPVLGSVLAQTGSVIVTSAQINWTAKIAGDIQVLFDRSFALNHASDVVVRERLNLHNVKQGFAAGASTGSNQIYVLLVGDDATGAHVPDVQAQYVSRFVYADA